jgi:hypothetical protein
LRIWCAMGDDWFRRLSKNIDVDRVTVSANPPGSSWPLQVRGGQRLAQRIRGPCGS